MLWWFAQSTLIAGALAVVATVAGRWKRLGPEVRHALWLAVLIKLAIPPFVAWPWSVTDAWPAFARVDSPGPAAVEIPTRAHAPVDLPPLEPEPTPVAGPPPSFEEWVDRVEVEAPPPPLQESEISTISDFKPPMAASEARAPDPDPTRPLPSIWGRKPEIWDWRTAVLALWLAGSVVVVARRAIKVVRFRRSVSGAGPAPAWLVEEARAIGERVGVRPPPIVATSGVGTPLLWCLGRPRLILPDALIGRLDRDRGPGILAHELAHLARRDHWVVRLELLVEAVWWWNPLFWHARRRLHDEAERACDARVVRSLPERRYAYAEALVDVCEHLARAAIPSPALGVGGAGASRSLEGRLLMILRDPIPRRPSRLAVLAALLLAALALPAWTLGQQADAPPSKPGAPPSKPDAAPRADLAPNPGAAPLADAAPKADTPGPVVPGSRPSSAASEATIEPIRVAQLKRRESLGNLAFRYIVAGRDQFHRSPRMGGAMGMMGGSQVQQRMGTDNRAANRAPIQSRKVVHIEVADVVLSVDKGSRLDVLSARPADGPPAAGPRPVHWDRRFVARDGSGIMTLETSWDKQGPVPFRWIGGGRPTSVGDTLASALAPGNNSTDPDKGIDPFDPRPESMLDLVGATEMLLNPGHATAEVAGADVIDGQEVVRVAWISLRQEGLRGICWLAPKLGFAVVRSDATRDPQPNNLRHPARLSWRKHASDFVEVDGFWLPRKVVYEESETEPSASAGQAAEPISRRERAITFEDYRVAPSTSATAFRPKLAVQALDDLSGNFTANPPELPPGLVDRLDRAVRESKFGPPIDEKVSEEPKPAALSQATLPAQSRSPFEATKPSGGAIAPTPFTDLPRPAITLPQPNPDAAKLDPGIIVRPAPRFEDSIPISQPKVEDPIQAKGPTGQAELDRMIQRQFKLDPEVAQLLAQIRTSKDKLDKTRQMVRSADDPTVRVAQRNLDSLMTKYNELWEAKSREFGKEGSERAMQARDEVELLQFRRDGKAAEVKKAEAQLALAEKISKRMQTLKERNAVSGDVLDESAAGLKVAEAELERKKSELAEADLYLNQAKRRLGPTEAPDPAPAPISTTTLPEFRDAIELQEAQLQGKQAELRGVELRVAQAKTELARMKANGAELQDSFADAKVAVEKVVAELDGKKAEVIEATVRLKQARRRAESEEARLKREIGRAKAELGNVEKMHKQGYVAEGQLNSARARYDELMFQLDPKYTPATPSPGSPSKP
jgi:beta-lactamase regulating signal transducer with metallopeptidase domain